MTDLTPVIEQFKTLREEILLREKQHIQIVIFKIISLGAAVSFIAERAMKVPSIGGISIDMVQYYIWLIPLLAVVFDTLIAGNLRSMYNIGPYIKQYIEPVFRHESPNDIRFWEETVASASSKYFCHTTPDLLFIWIFTIVPTLLIITVRYVSGFTKIDYIGMSVAIIFSIISLWYLVHSVKMVRDF